jgi:hypothetical protein
MTGKQVERFIKSRLAERLEGFHVRGPEFFAVPVGLVLNLVYFEASGWDRTSFSHVYAVAMPLWVPFPTFHFNNAVDLLHEERTGRRGIMPRPGRKLLDWVSLIDGIALPMFALLGTPEKLLDGLQAFVDSEALVGEKGETTPDIQEELAGAAIICNRLDRAAGHLSRAIRFYDDACDLYDWQERKLHDLRSLQAKVGRSRVEAIDLLKQWDASTVANLKLEPFLAPDRWQI